MAGEESRCVVVEQDEIAEGVRKHGDQSQRVFHFPELSAELWTLPGVRTGQDEGRHSSVCRSSLCKIQISDRLNWHSVARNVEEQARLPIDIHHEVDARVRVDVGVRFGFTFATGRCCGDRLLGDDVKCRAFLPGSGAMSDRVPDAEKDNWHETDKSQTLPGRTGIHRRPSR
jgi:hypothetical protein